MKRSFKENLKKMPKPQQRQELASSAGSATNIWENIPPPLALTWL